MLVFSYSQLHLFRRVLTTRSCNSELFFFYPTVSRPYFAIASPQSLSERRENHPSPDVPQIFFWMRWKGNFRWVSDDELVRHLSLVPATEGWILSKPRYLEKSFTKKLNQSDSLTSNTHQLAVYFFLCLFSVLLFHLNPARLASLSDSTSTFFLFTISVVVLSVINWLSNTGPNGSTRSCIFLFLTKFCPQFLSNPETNPILYKVGL